MTDAELLGLWDQLCTCVDACEDADGMLDEHDGHVPRAVRRAVKRLMAAANEAVFTISRASKKAERPSATVHPLRPVP